MIDEDDYIPPERFRVLENPEEYPEYFPKPKEDDE